MQTYNLIIFLSWLFFYLIEKVPKFYIIAYYLFLSFLLFYIIFTYFYRFLFFVFIIYFFSVSVFIFCTFISYTSDILPYFILFSKL